MDLQSAAVMAGKALNDPVAGISAMSRAGIQFTEDQKATIKALAEGGDMAGAQAIILKELETQFGGTAETMAQTSKGQMTQAMNTLGDAMEVVGGIIVPYLAKIADKVKELADKFQALSPKMQENIVKALGIVAALGPVLIIGGKLVTMLSKLNPWMIGLALVGGAIKLAMDALDISFGDILEVLGTFWEYISSVFTTGDALNDFLVDLPGPLQGVAEAFGNVVAVLQPLWAIFSGTLTGDMGKVKEGFVALPDGMKGIGTMIMDVIEKVKEFGDHLMGLVGLVVEHWDEIKTAFQVAAQFLLDTWNQIWDVLGPLIASIMEFINTQVADLVDFFKENWPMIQEVILKVLDIIRKAWERVWGIISKYIMPLWEGIKLVIGGAMDVIKGIIQTVLAIITGKWGKAWDGIKKVFSGVWDIIKGILGTALTAIKVIWDTALAALATAWDVLWGGLGNGITAIGDAVVGAIKWIINQMLTVLENGINFMIGLLNKAIEAYNAVPLAPDMGLIKKVSIPRLAEGGMTTNAGPVKVGERGPEIVNLPAGASVQPLTGGGGGVYVTIERLEGGDPKALAHEIGWELAKRGAA
jgi:phage-related protein